MMNELKKKKGVSPNLAGRFLIVQELSSHLCFNRKTRTICSFLDWLGVQLLSY